MERGKEMKIKIERKSPYTHQIFELENQVIIAESHWTTGSEVWCTVQFGNNLADCVRTPIEGTLEISAI